jgi:AraC-like DNA-binding protein
MFEANEDMCFLTKCARILVMLTPQPLLPAAPGFKRLFSAHPLAQREGVSIRGVGIREPMPAGLIRRREGTGDFLFMLFHDAAVVGTKDERLISVSPDSVMVWAPGMDQHYGNSRDGFRHSWLHASGPRLGEMVKAADIPIGQPFRTPDVALFLQCLSALHHEMACQFQPDFRILGNLLENCLRETGRALRGSIVALDGPLLAVRRQIDGGAYRLTLPEMARGAGMPVTTFSARFRKAFGFSPKGYVIHCRLSHAAHLLRNENLTVSEIATRVGYDDPFHFSKLFKKTFRVSPAIWRRHGKTPPKSNRHTSLTSRR